MRLRSDLFKIVRELVFQHGARIDLAAIAKATQLSEADLKARFGSFEALLIAALGPTPSAPPPPSPPPGPASEAVTTPHHPAQLLEVFARLSPASQESAPASEPEITRLTSLPEPPNASTR